MADPKTPVRKKSGNGRLFALIALGAFIVLVAWFTLQNAETVTFQFAIWKWDISLALLLFVCVFLGLLLAGMAVLPAFFNERRGRRRLEKIIAKLDKDLEAARKLAPAKPIDAPPQPPAEKQG